MAIKYYSYPQDKDIFLSEHFQMGEFVTYSDYYGDYPSTVPIDDGLPKTLEKVFDHFKCDYGIISSGYRTPACDAAVGGSGGGPHTMGIAVDVAFYKNGVAIPSRIVSCYLQYIGIKGIGLHCGGTQDWTHFDMRTETIWFGDEVDYSCGYDDFFSYTNTSWDEVFPEEKENIEEKPKKNQTPVSNNSRRLCASDTAIDFIKSYEGLSLKACKAISSEYYYTIGYGHYGSDVGANDTITEEEAENLLRKDLKVFEDAVNNSLTVTIAQNQFDALVSLAYNIGTGAITDSDIMSFINSNKIGHACVDFPSWRKAGGQILPGLQNRREKEMQMFGTDCDFVLTDNMNIRTGYGTNSQIKRVSQITENGKKCVINSSLSSNAVFKSGTEITALELKAIFSASTIEVWMRCPSGWICARMGDEVYIK